MLIFQFHGLILMEYTSLGQRARWKLVEKSKPGFSWAKCYILSFVCSYWIHSFPTCILFFRSISSVAQSCPTLRDPWTAACHASLGITSLRSLLRLISIELVMPSNDLILRHPLLLLPSIFPSIRVFSKESILPIRWPKYLTFSFSISPSNEYSGLISFRMDWLDLLAVQGTLKSLLQHHSSKASVFQCSAFFIV